MPGGAQHLTVDLSGLAVHRFGVGAGAGAGGPDLKERDETMMLRPQPAAENGPIPTGVDAGVKKPIAIPERTCTEPEPAGA